MASDAGAVADGLRDVALADAGLADQQHVVVAGDEVGGRQVDDLVAGDLRVEAEVEVLEGLAALEVRPAQARGRLFAVAAFDLVVQEPVEEFLEGESIVDGLAAAQIEGLEDAGQAQLLRMGMRSSVGCIGVFRGAASSSLKSRANRGRSSLPRSGRTTSGNGCMSRPLRRMFLMAP